MRVNEDTALLKTVSLNEGRNYYFSATKLSLERNKSLFITLVLNMVNHLFLAKYKLSIQCNKIHEVLYINGLHII